MSLTDLPIATLETEFHQLVPAHTLVVAASTGSGKSTCLPVWAARHGRVLVVQPRRVACLALAGFVASQLEGKPGERVGYAVRHEQCGSDQSEIMFVTPGVALRWYAQNRLAQFSHIILDEFHERRWDTDLLLAMLRLRAEHRLIVTSATLSAESLAQWLDARVLRCEGRHHPVAVRYLASESHHMPSSSQLEQRVRTAVEQALAESDGDVLVFLPGRGEIHRCASILQPLGVAVQALHGGVDVQAQNRALESTTQRRVILATNVAETSLTLPGITAVVDSGLERRTSQRNGRTVLGLASISMASATQRQGRAGRVGPGVCWRLWGEHAPLAAHTPGEIQRETLDELVLAAACAGFDVRDLPFYEALPEKSLAQALGTLREIGALTEECAITAYGQVLFPLPVDSYFAHLISAMPDVASTEVMVDLCAMLSRGVRVRLPGDEYNRQALQRWCPQACDVMTRIRLLRAPVPEFISVDETQLAEARQMAEQVRTHLGLPALAKASVPDMAVVAQALLRARPALAFVRRLKRTDALGNGATEVFAGEQSRFHDDAVAALVLDDHSVPGRRGTRQTLTVATCMLPVSFAQLATAGMGECRDSAPVLENGVLTLSRERHYAGRVLASERISPVGEAACQALAHLIMAGQLMPGVGATLENDMSAWQLFIALGLAEQDAKPAPLPPQRWLAQRLQQAGVECLDDLELLEPADLRFEGVPEWQRSEFEARWPREVVLSDLVMDVSYAPASKLVTLHWRTGGRKKDPARWELPGWQGWRIRYRRASRVIDIR